MADKSVFQLAHTIAAKKLRVLRRAAERGGKAMTPEKWARVVMEQARLTAQVGPATLAEAQEELIARAIREAVEAERRACAEVARDYGRHFVNRVAIVDEDCEAIAAAIEARKE